MNVERSIKADKSQRYRARKKALGLRQVRLWVPDVSDAAFLAKLKREGGLLRGHGSERDGQDLIDAILTDNPGFYD